MSVVVCILLASIVMVILNPDAMIQRITLALSIVALATMLNSKSSISDLKVHRNSDHNTTLNKLRHEESTHF